MGMATSNIVSQESQTNRQTKKEPKTAADVLLEEVEERALRNARAKCLELFSRPESLEEIKTIAYRVKIERNDNDSNLKIAIQSQLDSIKLAVEKLGKVSNDCSTLIEQSDVLFENLRQLQVASRNVQSLQETNKIHQQLKSITDNYDYIFNIQRYLTESHECLNRKRPDLLHAHYNLYKLENARDTCLLVIHKQSNNPNEPLDPTFLEFFKPTKKLYQDIKQKILNIYSKITEFVKTDPSLVVNCARIIEREEKLDSYAETQRIQFKFNPPDRPKKLKTQVLATMESILNGKINLLQNPRIETNFQTICDNLIENMQNDIMAANFVLKYCLPRDYDIVNWYLNKYHTKISSFVI